MFPFKYITLVKATVAVLLLYFGWLAIMIIVTPIVVYLHLRNLHDASFLQASFLALVSFFAMSWLCTLLLAKAW